jgi:putative endonuclease
MWHLYILYSDSIDRYYIGFTDSLEWRLFRHNQGWGRYSKRGIPWKIAYTEDCEIKSDALIREREIKSRKTRNYVESLIKNKLVTSCIPELIYLAWDICLNAQLAVKSYQDTQ